MDSDLGEEDIMREKTMEAGKVFGESDIWRKARRPRERGENVANEQKVEGQRILGLGGVKAGSFGNTGDNSVPRESSRDQNALENGNLLSRSASLPPTSRARARVKRVSLVILRSNSDYVGHFNRH